MTWAPTAGTVLEDLGTVASAQPVSGGDINRAYQVQMQDGTQYFLKTNSAAPQDMLEQEAEGLRWLGQFACIRVPEVIQTARQGKAAYLVLQWIESGTKTGACMELLGKSLAELHSYPQEKAGWVSNNYIGTLPQDNHDETQWAVFYQRRRLDPLLRRAKDLALVEASTLRRFDTLAKHLPQWLATDEALSPLHGDLWAGNIMCEARQHAAWFIDPACYRGAREVDLAMTKLFGGFSRGFYEAYEHHYPLPPLSEERIPIYQLYPLLVHLNLFGRSYLPQIEEILGRYT